MASSPSYDALVAFLEGDSADGVLEVVNAEQTDLLAAGSVYFSRAPRAASGTRKANSLPYVVEIVPRGEAKSKGVGIGYKEVSIALDLSCCFRGKATSEGASQLDVVEDMARAIAHRYDGVSQLAGLSDSVALNSYFGSYWPRPWFSVPYWGSDPDFLGSQFVRSTAERVEIDEDATSGERIRAVTRVTFNFLEARASNARA